MNLGIILNQPCVNNYLKELSRVQRVAKVDNGLQEKHKCLQLPIKKQEEDIAMDKERCDTCTCYECACDECTCECHEEAEATAKYNSLVNSTDYEGHWLNDSADVAEKGND
jgi:hypothetical protein